MSPAVPVLFHSDQLPVSLAALAQAAMLAQPAMPPQELAQRAKQAPASLVECVCHAQLVSSASVGLAAVSLAPPRHHIVSPVTLKMELVPSVQQAMALALALVMLAKQAISVMVQQSACHAHLEHIVPLELLVCLALQDLAAVLAKLASLAVAFAQVALLEVASPVVHAPLAPLVTSVLARYLALYAPLCLVRQAALNVIRRILYAADVQLALVSSMVSALNVYQALGVTALWLANHAHLELSALPGPLPTASLAIKVQVELLVSLAPWTLVSAPLVHLVMG